MSSHKVTSKPEKFCGFTWEELTKTVDNYGNMFAHRLARYHVEYVTMFLSNPELLKLVNNDGTSIAHILAEYQPSATSRLLAMPEILTICDKNHWYVAHSIARQKRSKLKGLYEMIEMLKLKDQDGKTVEDELRYWQKRRKREKKEDSPIRDALRYI